MQKKKIVITVILLIIILGIAFIFIFQGEKSDRVLSMYKKIKDSEEFTFSMEEVESDIQLKITVTHMGENINIDSENDGMLSSTLLLDGDIYFISHDEKEYYNYDIDDEEIENMDIILSALAGVEEKEYTQGEENIYGISYYYEEYDNMVDLLMLTSANDESEVKTRFYFDGDEIVYIKNIVTNGETEQEELLKVTLEYEADSTLFEIPSDYAEL